MDAVAPVEGFATRLWPVSSDRPRDDRAVGLRETRSDSPSRLISVVCYAFHAETTRRFESRLSGDDDADDPIWFIERLADRELAFALPFGGAWFDIGSLDGYVDAFSWRFGGGAAVRGSDLGESVDGTRATTGADPALEHTVVPHEVMRTDRATQSSIVGSGAEAPGFGFSNARTGANVSVA